jgi:hypothetical protein
MERRRSIGAQGRQESSTVLCTVFIRRFFHVASLLATQPLNLSSCGPRSISSQNNSRETAMPRSRHLRPTALAVSLVLALALAPRPSFAQFATATSQLEGKTTTRVDGTTTIRTNSSSSEPEGSSYLLFHVMGGIPALGLLAVAACIFRQRCTNNKNENVATDVSPPCPAFKPAIAVADEETGGDVSEQGGVQRLDEHQVDTDAVRTGVSTTEYSLPSPSAWDGLGGAAPSVDFYVPAPGDQNTVDVNSSSVSSVNPETLVSSYVTPPPLSS